MEPHEMRPQGRYRVAARGPSGEIMDLGECVCEGYGDWKSSETGASADFVVLWGGESSPRQFVGVDQIVTVEPVD